MKLATANLSQNLDILNIKFASKVAARQETSLSMLRYSAMESSRLSSDIPAHL